MHLVIANKLYSSWSLRPWMVMTALGIPFTETVIPMKQPDSRERILKYSPTGKCPVLIDGDVTIWESIAIIEYLAERFPDRGIWPRDLKARAHARAISAEMHAGFQALRQNCPMNLAARFAPKDWHDGVKADIARLEEMWAGTRKRFGVGGPFLFGAFSAADAMYAPGVTRLDTFQHAVKPETRAYMDAILRHSALMKWRIAALAEPWTIDEYEEGFTAVERYKKILATNEQHDDPDHETVALSRSDQQAGDRATHALGAGRQRAGRPVAHRGLFSGRGYNIDSLTVTETEHEKHLSRFTIVTKGTPAVIEQIKHQLERMVPVHRVQDITISGEPLERELALIKVAGKGEKRIESLRLAEIYGAKVIDASIEHFVFEITGPTPEIERFIRIMMELGLVEVSRTGIAAMGRGAQGM